MPAIVLIGAQWGDEGKGKATDLLGGRAQWVVRYQGGNNAGHTVVLPTGENFALVVESLEYVEMQRNLFEVLWAAGSEAAEHLPARAALSRQNN